MEVLKAPTRIVVKIITNPDGDPIPPYVLYVLRTPWSPISMSQQSSDTLNRTFTELKSKDEERRRLAAYDLYQLVSTASRGKTDKSLPMHNLTRSRAISG